MINVSGGRLRHGQGRFISLLARFGLAILLIGTLTPSAHTQTFDQAVTNACNVVGTCAGTPAASGGSTTALSKESSPVPERKFEKLMGPWNLYVAGD